MVKDEQLNSVKKRTQLITHRTDENHACLVVWNGRMKQTTNKAGLHSVISLLGAATYDWEYISGLLHKL